MARLVPGRLEHNSIRELDVTANERREFWKLQRFFIYADFPATAVKAQRLQAFGPSLHFTCSRQFGSAQTNNGDAPGVHWHFVCCVYLSWSVN